MNRIKIGVASLLVLMFHATVSAAPVTKCERDTINGDYGDAPASYGVACHDTNRWQQLGDDGLGGATLFGDASNPSNTDNAGWSTETSSGQAGEEDNGVSWSVSSDGSTWSNWGTNIPLVRGQFVRFQVSIERSIDGNHQFDQARLWLDWAGAGAFQAINDIVFDVVWKKDEDSDGVKYTGTTNDFNNDLNQYNSPDHWGQFVSAAIAVPLDAIIGETWLRARVICENSLSSATAQMLPTGYYHQGEVEDYSITIAREVSEPATIALSFLGFGLLLLRRKKS